MSDPKSPDDDEGAAAAQPPAPESYPVVPMEPGPSQAGGGGARYYHVAFDDLGLHSQRDLLLSAMDASRSRRSVPADEDPALEQFLNWPQLYWRLAEHYSISPEDLTRERLQSLIDEDQRAFERSCGLRGEAIMPGEEFEAMVRRTRELARKVAAR